ncbi:MAG: hypothetical protein K2N98_07485 [Lachnospiraceae bacterium]|nr:hypothetical protein [Lachnospiraceae bacterium]
MLAIVKIILLGIFSILPDSPFSSFFTDADTMGYLQFLNWVFPLDTCVYILFIWTLSLPFVVIVCLIWVFLRDVIIGLIKKAVALLLLA